MAVGMHKMRLGRGLASLIGEGEGSEFGEVEGQREVALDALKAGRHAWPMNALPTSDLETTLQSESTGHEDGFLILGLLGILGLLWRRKYLVAAFCAVGVLVASVVAISIANRYRSEVVVQARFPRQDPSLQSDVLLLMPASVIQTEVNLIRSREIAEGVVARLGLAKDPNFAEHSSLLSRALALTTFWHTRPSFSNSSVNSLIAARLLENLDVTNDANSLLIRISYTSTSPEQSARIANAFAEEYLRTREKKAAQRHLADLAATYGPKHPSVLKAQSQLEEVLGASQRERQRANSGLGVPAYSAVGPEAAFDCRCCLHLQLCGRNCLGFDFRASEYKFPERRRTRHRSQSALLRHLR